jgi:hypothetical protein
MIIERLEWEIKRGHVQDFLAVLKESEAAATAFRFRRIGTSKFGQQSVVVCDLEWESLDEREKVWAAWNLSPQAPAIYKKADELIVSGHVTVWNLAPK